LENKLKEEITAEIELIAGSGGVFEIVVDSKEIFSKKKTNRFPEYDEIIKLIKAL